MKARGPKNHSLILPDHLLFFNHSISSKSYTLITVMPFQTLEGDNSPYGSTHSQPAQHPASPGHSCADTDFDHKIQATDVEIAHASEMAAKGISLGPGLELLGRKAHPYQPPSPSPSLIAYGNGSKPPDKLFSLTWWSKTARRVSF